MIWLKESTASQEIPLGYFLDSTDGDTEETALSIANTDIKIWKTGATTLANKNSGGATHISNGVYYCTLDATDTNTLGPLTVFVHVSGALAVKVDCLVVPSNVYDSLIAGTDTLNADVTQWLGTAAATPSTAGVPEVDITYIGGAALSTTTAQIGANVVQVSGDATAADNLESDYDGTGYNKANSTIGTCTVNTDMRGTDSAALASNYTAARAGYLDNINGHTAQTGDSYARLGAPSGASIAADIAAVNAQFPPNFSGLDIDSNGTLDVNLIEILNDNAAAANFLADYDGTGYNKANSTIGTCTVNTDMRGTDSAALASNYTAARAGYLDNINGHTAQSGDSYARLGTPADTNIATDIANLNDISPAQVASEIADALNVDTWSELSAVPGASATITEMLRLIYAFTRNKTTQTSTTLTLRNNGDSGNIGSASVSDDGTTFTKDKLT